MRDFARHFVASTCHYALPTDGDRFRAQIVRQMLPYTLAERSPGSDELILLNREYKPLGYPTRRRARLDYSDPEYDMWAVARDAVDLTGLRAEGGFWYLYEPDASPWRSSDVAREYRERLRRVLGLVVIGPEGDA